MSTFSLVRNSSRSPDVAALLGILESRDVRYIVIGSVAAAVYGIELQAADLDIVPDTDTANLRSLVDALRGDGGEASWAIWALDRLGERREEVDFQAHGGARIGGMDA